MKTTKIDSLGDFEKVGLILRAVNHRLRQGIIDLLREHGKEMYVTDIYEKLGLTQSVTSQHLRFLREAGVLITERRGKFIYYSLNQKVLDKIRDFAQKIC